MHDLLVGHTMWIVSQEVSFQGLPGWGRKKVHRDDKKADRTWYNLNEKERHLTEDKKKADEEAKLVEKMLEDAAQSLGKAIKDRDMMEIRLAKEIFEISRSICKSAMPHTNQQRELQC